jgi:hypothetical protein
VSELQHPAPRLQGYTPSGTQTNSLAIVSLASSILSFFAHVIPLLGGFTVALIAIITGFMARGQIQRTGEQGMWMANAGILIGVIHIALGLIFILVLIFFVVVLGFALIGFAAHSGGSPTPSPIGIP